MKIFIGVVAILFSASAFAVQIQAKDFSSYQEAVIMAIAARRPAMSCTLTNEFTIYGKPATAKAAVELASSADLFPGEQPLLHFYYTEGSESMVVTVTTTADYKNVVSVQVTLFDTATHRVNKGTIAQPNIVDVTTNSVIATADCK